MFTFLNRLHLIPHPGRLLMVGTTVSHYKILEHLGGGGMGVVYKARDTTLDRIVALKFLPPDVAADPEASKRLTHEAKAASALDHANICAIHEIGEQDGQTFIVMGYYEGETLKETIQRGPLSPDDATRIAVQIARGLAAAHAAGIIHRDIKPANIVLIRDGTPKILDFGLARAAGRTLMTRSGATLGTAAYMSPEQARGDPVDGRTDIWSLGVVLYEMLTGERPFRSDYELALMYSVLNEDPKPPRDLRPDIPPSLERVVLRALAKNPEERYRTAEEFISDLESPAGPDRNPKGVRKFRVRTRTILIAGAAAVAGVCAGVLLFTSAGRSAGIDTIAVLPFHDLSRDTTQEYFADGLTEELITKLWQVGHLKVRPRSAVMRFRNSEKSLAEIGRELGVKGLIVPTMVRVGDRIRITPSLIDAETETILWTKDFERGTKDIFALQSEISQAIVKEMSVRLLPGERARLAGARTVRPEAHDAYLKGTFLLQKGKLSDMPKALDLFRQAIALDSTFALAYVGYAHAIDALGWDMTQPPEESYPKKLSAISKAIRQDPDLAEAHALLGGMKAYHDYDLQGGESEMRAAVDLNPGSADVHMSLGALLAATGRYEESLASLNRAIDLDPMDLGKKVYLGQIHWFYRRFDQAIRICREVVDIAPEIADAHGVLGGVYLLQGRYSESLAEFQTEQRLEAGSVYDEWNFAWLYARMGQEKRARQYLDVLLASDNRKYFNQTLIAGIYGELHEPDTAFAYLERAFQRHEPSLVNWMKAGPAFDSLRTDPRFGVYLKKIGLEQ